MASLLIILAFTATLFIPRISSAPFQQVLRPTWGNIDPSPDGKTARLTLNRQQGAGFVSLNSYTYGFYSANIKLPSNSNAAGVVVTLYLSNGDVYKNDHDELDFEFLGNIPGKPWRLQTNVYGNGSDVKHRGREERYNLWFDPSQESHQYSILITEKHAIFYIDQLPIREVVRSRGIGEDYPSKPMSLYGSIWDGSGWATNGGKHKTDYASAPFVSEYSDFVVNGCASEPCNVDANITPRQRLAMMNFRRKYMTYYYCSDRQRYNPPLADCVHSR